MESEIGCTLKALVESSNLQGWDGAEGEVCGGSSKPWTLGQKKLGSCGNFAETAPQKRRFLPIFHRYTDFIGYSPEAPSGTGYQAVLRPQPWRTHSPSPQVL